MLAAGQRIASGSEFSRTLKSGARVHTHHLVVHVAPLPRRWPDPSGVRTDVASTGGPRLGLIVSRKTGNAVVRHRVARRLRAAFADVSNILPDAEALVVVRVKPGVSQVSLSVLMSELRSAFEHRKVVAAFDRARAEGLFT